MIDTNIIVALATYNGAPWLNAQLASIARQTVRAKVIASDDGSDDDTVQILENWIDKLPGGLVVLPKTGRRLGAKENFNRIFESSDAEWIACCDQDDVWEERHLERLLDLTPNADGPVLVVGDLTVCDANLNIINHSFRHMQKFNAKQGAEFRTACVMNIFPGCAMIFNKALASIALPIPKEAIMHDWWLALCAITHGRIIATDKIVGLYRLHGHNAVGAKSFSAMRASMNLLKGLSKFSEDQKRSSLQCAEFMRRYQDNLSAENLRTISAAASLGSGSWLSRKVTIVKSGLRKHPWPRHLNFLLRG